MSTASTTTTKVQGPSYGWAFFHAIGAVSLGAYFPLLAIFWSVYAGLCVADIILAPTAIFIGKTVKSNEALTTRDFVVAFGTAALGVTGLLWGQPVNGGTAHPFGDVQALIGAALIAVIIGSIAWSANRYIPVLRKPYDDHLLWDGPLAHIFGAGVTATDINVTCGVVAHDGGTVALHPVGDKVAYAIATDKPGIDDRLRASRPHLELDPRSDHTWAALVPVSPETEKRRASLLATGGLIENIEDLDVDLELPDFSTPVLEDAPAAQVSLEKPAPDFNSAFNLPDAVPNGAPISPAGSGADHTMTAEDFQ